MIAAQAGAGAFRVVKHQKAKADAEEYTNNPGRDGAGRYQVADGAK